MSRQTPFAANLLVVALATALLVAADGAAGQEIVHSSRCQPLGSDVHPVGASILFEYREEAPEPEPPPVIPKLPVQVYPPCVDVTLTAADVAGRPPLVVAWEAPDGTTWTGPTAQVDTGTLPTGVTSFTLSVSNADGQLVEAISLWVPQLEPDLPAPTPDQSPSPDLQVSFAAQAPGAHEWRWDFGDGTVTPWQETCDFSTSTAVHTYAEAGTYAVVAYARNCRDGAVASDPLVIDVGGGGA